WSAEGHRAPRKISRRASSGRAACRRGATGAGRRPSGSGARSTLRVAGGERKLECPLVHWPSYCRHGVAAGVFAMNQIPSVSSKALRTDVPMRRRRGLYADCLRTYLKVIARLEDDRQLDRILLRTGSRRGLDLLALHATDGRMRLADLLGHVEQDGTSFESLAAASGRPVDPALLVRTARVLALQDQQPDDRA